MGEQMHEPVHFIDDCPEDMELDLSDHTSTVHYKKRQHMAIANP
jgi:hypothetical protein